ncbi:MAG: SMC-Scp complex subunit ScpB [Candidatus Bathyarchaeia archaeon]
MSETQQIEASADERTKNQVMLIEAALYVTGKPLDVGVLGSILNMRSEEKIRKLATVLKEKYAQHPGALEVLELSDGRYVMQLKPGFSKSVKRLATRQLLTPGPLKTLSYIALRQPVAQSHVVKVRGNLAYGHVKQLRDMGLISEEKLGRSKVLRTTASFCDYFNLSQDSRLMKKQIQEIIEEMKSAQSIAPRPAQTQEAQASMPQEAQTNPPQEQTNPSESSKPTNARSQ